VIGVAVDLEHELEELTAPAVACRLCGHGFPEHEAGGGRCAGRIGGWSSPANAIPCVCPGFRWVDASGPPVGSYLEPPEGTAPK
jgi:hypothetical protein